MIETFLFSERPEMGLRSYFHYDHATDESYLETVQEMDAVVEQNKARYNQFDERSNWKGDYHAVAEVPMATYAEWLRDGRVNDQAFIRKWVNDTQENGRHRLRPGRI